MCAKSKAYLQLHKFCKECLARKEVEDNFLSVKKALCKTKQELEMAKLLTKQCNATKRKMKKGMGKKIVDGQST